MQKAIDRVQTSTLGPEAAEKGALAAMNEAVQVLPETIPSPLHIGYAFAKQDAYKLSKMGVAFSNADETADHRTAARTPGNKVPEPADLVQQTYDLGRRDGEAFALSYRSARGRETAPAGAPRRSRPRLARGRAASAHLGVSNR